MQGYLIQKLASLLDSQGRQQGWPANGPQVGLWPLECSLQPVCNPLVCSNLDAVQLKGLETREQGQLGGGPPPPSVWLT